MDFLKDFEKQVSKIEGVTGTSEPPRYWTSIGNYVLNHTLSGDFEKGIPQGRVVGLAGPSGAGKSFILGSAMREAQRAGAFLLVIDSENAFDDDFARAIGIDPTPPEEGGTYIYKSVTTIPQVTKVISSFLKGYKKSYGSDPNAPKILIAIDSLDMLMTETEQDHYDKGEAKGDQGQRNKQLKAMLRTFVQDIKTLNVSIVATSQVYRNQDVKNGEGVWIVSDAVRYSMSMIALLTKLRLKGDKNYEGIKLKCQGFKTRFTKPFQIVEIEVPYDTGLDPYAGLIEAAETVGVVIRRGSYKQIQGEDDNWYAKDLDDDKASRILDKLKALKHLEFHVDTGSSEDSDQSDGETATARRRNKHNGDD